VANVGKKLPMPGVAFSSQSFMAGIEVEVADAATPRQIQERIRQVYQLLAQTIDAEIAAQGAARSPALPEKRFPEQPAVRNGYGEQRNGSDNGGRKATKAQVKAVFAIAKAAGMSRAELLDLVHREFHADKPDALTVKAASNLIERLKAMQESAR